MRGESVIAKLLNNLTRLPLAIKQAAAYLNENTMSVFDYLRLYEANDELVWVVQEWIEEQAI